ncbi:MAG TPA: NAD(P)/FAD-dependent oxidoreductase [Candidatus Limnocylindria bacterium]|nr:NAD(P)/FAD-dependent oxidoreductase [Candidatus Limnocylindria bacterium]
MSSEHFDTVVIGAGSAGYAAARTLSAGGVKVAVLEGGREVGGLCILRGCMPTKALLHAAELRHAIRQAEDWGITAGPVTVDVAKLFAKKDALITDFAGYRRQQLERGKFSFMLNHGQFTDTHTLALDDGRHLTAGHFIIATGSVIAPPMVPGLTEAGYLTSDDALALRRLPESLVVLGGGAVAVEFAQFFQRLGTRVTLIQRGHHLLRGFDEEAARELEKALRREGMTLYTGTKIVRTEATPTGKQVEFEHEGRTVTIEAEEIFYGLGRTPNTTGLALGAAGVTTHGHRILTDRQQRTSVPHIFAAGDCCGPHEIVHVAIQQAEVAARNILRPHEPAEMDYRLLTTVVFSDPAVAQTGLTEREAREKGIDLITASYPFNDHGKSMILGAEGGFVKLLADRSTGELLGGACIGPDGGELIHEITVALSKRMTAAELAAVPHYHPTLAEIWTYPAEELAEAVTPVK